MSDRNILTLIRTRRNVTRFTADPVPEEDLQAILEAGRWAPSAYNAQPWAFVVLRDSAVRSEAVGILGRLTVAWKGLAQAPVLVVVAVDPEMDPYHFVEDGAAAAQNMALAACAFGLSSCWAGVYGGGKATGAESALRALCGLPKTWRVIAAMPFGKPAYEAKADRKPLAQFVHADRYRPGSGSET